MLSNNEIKKYSSLKHKKFRNELGLFLVEGQKSIEELIKSRIEIVHILGTENSLQKAQLTGKDYAEQVNSKTLDRISNMKSASDLIAIARTPRNVEKSIKGKTILIDDIQDPGNLGTIIRTAHWFGFEQIICSENSVDLYNFKVIQASMGSVFKIQVSYDDLGKCIGEFQENGLRILGAFMEGDSIYDFKFSKQDVFVLGNEGKGISKPVEQLVDQKITIPNFASGDQTESLNISIAGAVICSEMAKSLI